MSDRPIALPSSGSVYLDANGFIYSMERIEPYGSLLLPMWQAAKRGELEIVSSELVILETLVKPLRDRDVTLQKLFRELFRAREVHLVPTTTSIWESAAHIRATTGLKTPDAIHAASALAAGAELVLTNDPHFRRISDPPVVIMSDLVGKPTD